MNDQRRVAHNTLYLLALTASNYFVGLLIFPYIARVLSVEKFGVIGFGMAIAPILQSIVDYGFMISVTGAISACRNDRSEISRIIATTVVAKLILLIIATSAFLVACAAVDMVKTNALIMTGFFLSAMAAGWVPDFYFRGTEQMRSIAIRSLITKLISISLIFYVVSDDRQAAAIPFLLFFGNLFAVIWGYTLVKRAGITLYIAKLDEGIKALKDGALFFFSRLSATLNQALGALTLGLAFSEPSKELGIYSAAWRIAAAGEMLLIPFSDSLYPHMIRTKDYRFFWRVYSYGVFLWFLVCSGVYFYAHEICGVLLGRAYESAGEVLRVLLFGTFMAFSSNMFGYNALAPLGLAKHANLAIVLVTFLNVLASLYLLATNHVTVLAVAAISAASNFTIFIYRATVFFRHRSLSLLG